MGTKVQSTQHNLRDRVANNPSFLLSREQVEDLYGLPKRWLELAAWRDSGPPMVRISRRMVRYRAADIEAWLAQRCVGTELQEEGR
jgi:predicted DNA-binding transcriptional regulator AlpA